VKDTPKPQLKSLPKEDAHLKRQPIRRLNASSLGKCPRDTATNDTSRCSKCWRAASTWSAPNEQPTQPKSTQISPGAALKDNVLL
jgi:hypothetical protein